MHLSSWTVALAIHCLLFGIQFVSASADAFNTILQRYEQEINESPNDFLPYFKRATTYIAYGKTNQAIADLGRVLTLEPNYDQALLQRGKLLLQDGQFDLGMQDLQSYLKASGDANNEVQELLLSAKNAKNAALQVDKLLRSSKHEEAIQLLTQIIAVATANADFRMKRADCYIATGNQETAIGDLVRASHLRANNINALLKLANIYTELGEFDKTLEAVKECLKFDPDQKECKSIFRNTKKLTKAMEQINGAMESKSWKTALEKILGASNDGLLREAEKINSKILQAKLYAYSCKASGELKHAANTANYCSKAIEFDDHNAELYMYRGEAKIDLEEYEEAARDLKSAHDRDQNNRRIVDGFRKAQKLQKMAARKDYYKVLGVSRSASEKEIKKAFRKLAQEWHPDKHTEKKVAEKKMAELNEAYGVLSDKELRERYDNGDDPNDPHGGAGPHHGSPFGNPIFEQFFAGGGGGFPFGAGGNGGNFHFKFDF